MTQVDDTATLRLHMSADPTPTTIQTLNQALDRWMAITKIHNPVERFKALQEFTPETIEQLRYSVNATIAIVVWELQKPPYNMNGGDIARALGITRQYVSHLKGKK